jgi:hypothetical protein
MVMKYFPNIKFFQILFWIPKIREFDFSSSIFLEKREGIYDYINDQFVKDETLSYLEFGVYKGDSISYWTHINRNENSEFVGFDTFTGLPENWDNMLGGMRKNYFSTNGVTPDIQDKRCSFVKGMFQDTLKDFLNTFKPKNKLIIHNDSDLYTSTLFTLAKLSPFLVKDVIIIFDEFSSILHEMRAFQDFTSSHLIKYKILCHTKNYSQVAVMIL